MAFRPEQACHTPQGGNGSLYCAAGVVAAWTQPIGTAIELNETAIRAAIETGNPVFTCNCSLLSLTYRLLRGDPLDLVWRESETALGLIRKAKYGDVADGVVSQQRFIATMRGQTSNFAAFTDAQFDEGAFEAQLSGSRNALVACWYWILKMEARFFSGNWAAALDAAAKAKQLLPAAGGQIALLDYFYYAALTVSSLYETASADEQKAWRELLAEHQELLREWTENNPPTFTDKLALVSAEIARIVIRDADALRLYEEAVRSAHNNGFVQNEGLAHELAAQYYLSRGVESAGYFHLRNARHCYDRWGAHGKTKQLDECYPRLREEPSSAAAISVQAEQLDVETVVKASQTLSSEMVLPKLIEKLVRIATENAEAERGLLILLRGGEPRIEAEATAGPARIEVAVREKTVAPSDLPQSVLHYVIRTQENVLLEDAASDKVYSRDE